MSTVSQFLAMASGGSGGLTPFREVYQNTDTPYAYTTGSPIILNLSTAASIYDLQTVHPGYPTIIHDTTITNDIVRYTISSGPLDHYNGYTVVAAAKDTLTTQTSVTILINNLTGAVRELTRPSNGNSQFNAWIIGGDGFVYYFDSDGTGGSILSTASGNATHSVYGYPIRVTTYSLSTGAQVGQVQGTLGYLVSDGGSTTGSSEIRFYFSRPSAVNTGYCAIGCFSQTTDRSSSVDTTYSSFASAYAITKVTFNGASTTISNIANGSANGSGPGNGNATSGSQQGILMSISGGVQGGCTFTTYNYSYSTQSFQQSTTWLFFDETREHAFNNANNAALPPSFFQGSPAMLKDGSTVTIVWKQSATEMRAMFAGDTQSSRGFTLTMANPALNNTSSGQMDRCMQYGTYKNRFICGTAVYTINATAKTIVYNKTLYTVPGNNTVLAAGGCRSWEKAIYISNSVSGEITQLYLNGVDVNAADPVIIATKSGSPVGFSASEFRGNYGDSQVGVFQPNFVYNGFGGNTVGGDIITQHGIYGVVSGERLTRTWTGITSGSTITASSDLGLSTRIPYMSGSNYVNATLKGLLVGSVARFDKVRFTVRLPAYTNTSTGASTILIRILPNANELKNIRIVSTPSQDVYVHSATQLGVRVGAGTNIVAEDVLIEADPILRFTGGGLLVDNTYNPLTGTVTLTLSNLAASSRLMSELFE